MSIIVTRLLFLLGAPALGAEQRRRFGQAILLGYFSMGLLAFLTDKLLTRNGSEAPSLFVYMFIAATDALYSVLGGFLCAMRAGKSMMRAATFCLIIFGEISVLASTGAAWEIQPRWFSTALLVLFPVGAWVGLYLRSSRSVDLGHELKRSIHG